MTPTRADLQDPILRSPRAKLAILGAAVALALLALPASAHAIGFGAVSAQPVNPQAGANSDFKIHVEFTSPGDQVRNLVIGLPAGQIGDPTATPRCTVVELNADACPATTTVGEVTAVANLLGIPLPITATGLLYNLAPQPGEPARFGIVLHPLGLGLVPPIVLQSAVQLRPGDFGLNTVIDEIPNTTLLPGDTSIVSQDITLYGIAPGTGRPFSRNPTSCSPAVTTFSATSYGGPTTVTPATGQASYTPTGCAALPFSPSFSAALEAPSPIEPGAKPALTTVIEQDQGEAGLRNATVKVPSDLAAVAEEIVNPGELCTQAQFQSHACPAQTLVGTALATSPLLSAPLSGPVALLDNPGGVVQVGLDLRGELSLLLRGQLALDNTTSFVDLPDIPIAHFELTFKGGAGGLLALNRDICLPPPPLFGTAFVAHSGASRAGSTPATVSGCDPNRGPSVQIKLKRAKSRHPLLKLRARPTSGFQPLRRLSLKLPPQLAFTGDGSIRAKVTEGGKLRKSRLRAKGRRLLVKLPSYGAPGVVVKARGGALVRRGRLPRKGARFKAKLTDTEGNVTPLPTRIRPKR